MKAEMIIPAGIDADILEYYTSTLQVSPYSQQNRRNSTTPAVGMGIGMCIYQYNRTCRLKPPAGTMVIHSFTCTC